MSNRWAAFAWGVLLLAGFLGGCQPEQRAPSTGSISLGSSPESGAKVTIGRTEYGETPVTIDTLPAGKLLVVLSKDGFRRTTQMIEVMAGERQRVVIAMEPLVGYVTIESKPLGAQVFLDTLEYLGDTPLVEKPIAVGEHTYELRKANYKTATNKVSVQPDYRYTFAHQLEPQEGRLMVFSRPTNARIWLNDEPRVETTPAKIELNPGEYTVRVHSKGYIMAEANIILEANEDRSLELVMKEGSAPPGMVLVPAGEFLMGVDGASPDERPRRAVEVDAFYIDKFEVTNEDYRAVFSDHAFPKGKEMHPVVGVSFQQATEFAEAVGKRLPTEAEWEKAARGVDGREYPWGVEFQKDLCNSSLSGVKDAVRVGQYRLGASPYGCMDMAGNAYEWTSSWYQAYPGNNDVTKDYGQVFRVLRGGSFLTDRFAVRCARRHYDRMDAARRDYGLRCAKDVAELPGLP